MPDILLSFEDLHAGDRVGTQYIADGVSISSGNQHNPPMIFDTSHPTGGDTDLATDNLGNVLILSEDNDSGDPDDNAAGGTLIFDFTEPSEVVSLRVLDIEEGGDIRLYNAHGDLIKTVQLPHTGNNGQADVHIDAQDVVRMEITLCGSGAIDNVSYITPAQALDGIVEGTAAGDMIDGTYVDDPEGDRVDCSDAILPGQGPQDDIIVAGGGDDTVFANLGDDIVVGGDGHDIVFGQSGSDELLGEAGNDSMDGGSGNDTLVGGAGDDVLLGGADADTLYGGSGGDSIGGGDGSDLIHGGDGDDSLRGEDGNDTVAGGAGQDSIDGGLGDDVLYGGGSGGSGENLIFNGSFEDIGTAESRGYGYEAQSGIPGWTESTGAEFDIHNDGRDGLDATDGQNWLDLEASPGGVRVGQNVNGLEDGRLYMLTFDAGDTSAENNLMQVIWGGDVISTIDPSDGSFSTYEFMLEGGAGNGGNRLEFANLGSSGNGNIGASVDRVSLVAVDGEEDASGDVITGGAGRDQIFGQGGDDTITGGTEADTLSGGADRDTFLGGTDGDRVDGGAAGDDYDVLDLRGQGPFSVINEVPDSNGNGTNGTVQFLDANGDVTGTLEFVEIEEILGDRVNLGPNARDDTGATDEDDSVVLDVLTNDSDPEGDPLSVISASAANGQVQINPDNTLRYTPDPNFWGDDTITYTISDGHGGTDTATVTMAITPVNDRPDAVDDVATVAWQTPTLLQPMANDQDPDGDPMRVVSASSPDGEVVINGDGTVSFTPDPDFSGPTEIAYTITDDNDGFDSAIMRITVLPEPLDGIVQGTDADDLIDETYEDDPQGDRIDSNDAILPGEAPQDDIVRAGDGDDTVRAGEGDDDVEGGAGRDDIDGGTGDDSLDGGIGRDTLTGGDGSDTVLGGDGDDRIETGGGPDPLPDRGYPGLFPADSDPENDRDFVDGGAGNDTISTGDDRDTITGGTGDDSINAGFDDDVIDGGSGADFIIGGEGADLIDGGVGDDTIYGGTGPNIPDAVNIADVDGDLVPDNGTDAIRGGAGNDVIYGEDDDDVISGDDGDDFIDGGVDDDVLAGGTGNDTLIGGQGADEQAGGDDRDLFEVGSAEDGDGDLIDGGSGGDDFDTLDLSGSGPLNIVYTSDDREDGFVEFLDGVGGNVTGTLTFAEIENIVPCFTPGTVIATPRGEVLVEHLRVGDKVITRDNGLQEVRWVGSKPIGQHELQQAPHLQPVLIHAGALGNGLPERDMLVSPNHRMLVKNDRVSLYFDEREVLVSAKHLVNPSQGVRNFAAGATTYIHFMFDNHEVVLSNGAWTESFQPGDYSLKGIGNAQRNEIFELFPELQGTQGREAYSSARMTLKKHEAQMLFK